MKEADDHLVQKLSSWPPKNMEQNPKKGLNTHRRPNAEIGLTWALMGVLERSCLWQIAG